MKKALRYIFIGIILVVVICGYYYYLSHKNVPSAGDVEVSVSEVEAVLAKDFEESYPSTPREVMKNYNRIITCFYNEEYTEDQLVELAQQARRLMDDELLELNPFEQYMADLQSEIDLYKMNEKVIVKSTVSDSNDVIYKVVKGQQCAYVTSYYFCKEGKSDFTRTYEKFVLRKDSSGNWKILAWKLIDGDEEE